MKKLLSSIIVLSALTLLCSIGWGCGDSKAQELPDDFQGISKVDSATITPEEWQWIQKNILYPPDKCPLILNVNSTSMEINHCFYMPDVDGWVVNRASDSTDSFIQRDTVYFFHIHK